MSIYEIIAVLFSFISVILTVKENKWCWPVGIIGIIFYAIIFYQENLMANFWLQFLFAGQSILGMLNWNKPKNDLNITWFSDITLLFAMTGLSYMFTVLILGLGETNLIHTDALTTVLSVFAMFMIAYKVIEGWVYWIVADLIYIYMFYESGFYLSSIIYLIFLCLSTIGLIKWSKSIKTA